MLLQSSGSELGDEFTKLCVKNGIRIHYQLTMPVIKNYDGEPEGRFKESFSKIKDIGVKIILTVARKPTSFYLFTEALR